MLARGAVVVTCTALLFGHPGVSGATASGDDCRDTEPALRYLVLFDQGTAAGTALDEVSAACGDVTVYYPEIAVAVATATGPELARRLGHDRVFSATGERFAPQARPAPASTWQGPGAIGVPRADRTPEQWALRAVHADAAHAVERGSREVTVGVLDSGVDARHPDLAHAVDPSASAGCLTGAPDPAVSAWSPTTSPHGTHVAGIIAAADDGAGVTGVAPGVRVASVKVIDDEGYVTPEAAVCGLLWAVHHDMAVANSSFLVAPWPVPCASPPGHQVVREALARAVEYAERHGTLTVAAATNDAAELTPSPGSGAATGRGTTCEALPAGLPHVLAVSAVDRAGVKTTYSSYGLGVIDLTAPGGGHDCVLSTVPGGYDSLCGTSMAAPHVAGVAALVASRHPGATPRRMRAALAGHATPLACPDDYDLGGDGRQDAYCSGYARYNSFYGRGLVDALAAVSAPT